MTLPLYLTEQTEEAIMQRMLAQVPEDVDKTEGSYIWDSLAPVSIELAQGAIWAQEVLRRGFASTTYGEYLDLRCTEHGLARRPAVKATGQATFYGVSGTVIPTGTRVATSSDGENPSREFQTINSAVISESGSTTVSIEALESGIGSNVAAGTICIIQQSLTGLTGVSNSTATSGGLDTESDSSLLSRYLQKVQSPSAGGNIADYINWALEVTGVGGVSVIPVRDGAGTVSIAIIDTDKQPAGQPLVEAVQNYIAPPYIHPVEAETLLIGGNGTSLDSTLENGTVTGVKMVYDASGDGTINQQNIHSLLAKPGIWQVQPKIKVDANTGTADLLSLSIWNLTQGSWAKTTPLGSVDALLTLKANQLSLVFESCGQEFYWNGTDELELRISRKQADTATTVWVDNLIYRSTFSKDTGEGKAPIGAKVTVEPALPININVSAILSIVGGYNADTIKTAVAANIDQYLKSLAFTPENDVRYVRIGQVILDTPGVQDYTNLLVNEGTANIDIGVQQVAVKGTVTLA